MLYPDQVVVTGAFSYAVSYVARRPLDQGARVRTPACNPWWQSPCGGRVVAAPWQSGPSCWISTYRVLAEPSANAGWVVYDANVPLPVWGLAQSINSGPLRIVVKNLRGRLTDDAENSTTPAITRGSGNGCPEHWEMREWTRDYREGSSIFRSGCLRAISKLGESEPATVGSVCEAIDGV